MIKIREVVGHARQTRIWPGWLPEECRIRFRDEQTGRDNLALWARRAAGAALIAFGLAVLINSLVGGS